MDRVKLDFGQLCPPVFAAEPDLQNGNYKATRFCGSGFFVSSSGLFATCGHVADMIGKTEKAALFLGNFRWALIEEIRRHQKYDFALLRAPDIQNQFLKRTEQPPHMGMDCAGFGYVDEPMEGGKLGAVTRWFSGNVVRFWENSTITAARSTFELLFPVLSGMSGGPLLDRSTWGGPFLAGMLHGNAESRIQSYAAEETEADGEKIRETVNRIVELGCAHTIVDIAAFINDLGFGDQAWK